MTMISQITASGGGAAPNYIEDVFSTYLYTGNGSTQTITNGIDLSTKGGLVWIKIRGLNGGEEDHRLYDTVRGAGNSLVTNRTVATQTQSNSLGGFNANGFSLNGLYLGTNGAGYNYASWTFRKQPKFFDVVTYTGTGSARTVAHNLGSVPGCIIVKNITNASNWVVYHRSTGATQRGVLNSTVAFGANAGMWNNTEPTSTVFTVGTGDTNTSGDSFVAYLFAHDAGGFGLTGTDNVISCGSFTSDSLGQASVNLGYEPQWVMIKRTDGTSDWTMLDNMRGWAVTTSGDAALQANTSNAETSGTEWGYPTATGFSVNEPNGSTNWIYIAIRRGPMKVPTDATKVFVPVLQSNSSTPQSKNYGFVTDSVLAAPRNSAGYANSYWSRLQGANRFLQTQQTAAEETTITDALIGFDYQTGVRIGADSGGWIQNLSNFVHYAFQRAPNFFDEVCYTGTGSARSITHNLGVAPELIFIKKRSATGNWATSVSFTPTNSKVGYLNTNYDLGTAAYSSSGFISGQPTATTISVGTDTAVNASGSTYVAYLFASCPGVSKVGSYTGTGTTQQINCGFTGGARFILIKRTDSTGDWYVYDSARGIVAGNDPYLLLNSTAAEVTSTDYVDTYAAGFELSSTAPAALNASGGTFIFLAIA